MKEFFARMRRLGFFASVTADSETFEWWMNIRHADKNFAFFRGEDLECLIIDAIRYAENYDAYVVTAPKCHHE